MTFKVFFEIYVLIFNYLFQFQLKDFLMAYNRISETCFLHCVNHLSDRDLSQDETKCVDMCTKKHVNVNHKIMQVYVEVQPQIVNKRMEDMTKQQQAALEQAKKTEELESSQKAEIVSSQNAQINKVDAKELNVKVSDEKLGSQDNEMVLRTK